MHCPNCAKPLVDDAVFCPHCNHRIEGADECTDYQYEAFISYRHLPLDRTAAVKIQRAIEGFRIPKQLAQSAGKQRLGKCFRDEDELPTSSSLSEQIENALRHSRFLIVVCSKRTRESLWVMREVELYSSYHGRDRVLIALAEGEPSDSFPELLLTLTRKDAEGQLQEVAAEPLGADMRDLRRSKFNVEKLRLIAPIVGCNFDDLRQRARLRRNRTIAAIASGVAAVSLAFGGVSTYQQIQIQQSYHQIQMQQSESLARESTDLLAQGDRYQALQVALAALPESATSADRPFVPAAQMALEQSLGIYPGKTDWTSCYSSTDVYGRGDEEAAFDGEGLTASIASNGNIEVWETSTGSRVCKIDALSALGMDPSTNLYSSGLEIADGKVVFVCEGAMGCFDAREGTLLWGMPVKGIVNHECALAVSPDNTKAAVAVFDEYGKNAVDILVLDMATGKTQLSAKLPGYAEAGLSDGQTKGYPNLEFFPDGTHLAAGCWGSLHDINLADGSSTAHALHYETVDDIAFADGLVAVVSEDFSGDMLGGPTCLEVFDSSYNLLWDKTADLELSYDVNGNVYRHNSGVYGTWNYYEGDDKQLVVLFGAQLLLLDATTGEQVFGITGASNYEDCVVAPARQGGTPRIFAITHDGTVICRKPLASNSGKGGLVGDASLDASNVLSAQLAKSDDRVYCCVWTNYPNKYAVYRHAAPEDLVDGQVLDTQIGNSDSTLWFNKQLAYKKTADGLILADSTALDQTTVVPKDSLETLDWERDSSIEMTGDNDGFLYVLGNSKESARTSVGRWVVYRVAKDGSAELKLTFDSATADQFSTVVDETGKPLLLVIFGLRNEENERVQHVVLMDMQSEDDSLIADVMAPDARVAWYGNGNIVAYCEDSEGNNARFAMFNAKTGEEISGDLGRFMVDSKSSCKTKCSIAPDGKTFAVACNDGLVRMFDTSTGAMLWETAQVPSTVQIIMIGKDGNLVVQDAFGQCLLVSGKTGDVMSASSSTLPLIRGINNWSDDTALATFADIGMNAVSGFALISLDEQAFGPQSILYHCQFISPDCRQVVFRDEYTGDLYTARRLTLDELIATGSEMAAGHELTDAERHLYQVEG